MSETPYRPRSIYQYSARLLGQTSIFGVVFFVSKSLLGIERQKEVKNFTILTRKPRSHVRILIYRTWPIGDRKCRKRHKPKNDLNNVTLIHMSQLLEYNSVSIHKKEIM